MSCPQYARKGLLLLQSAPVFLVVGTVSAMAGEVDLDSAGCPELPAEDRFMTVHMILDGQGAARDCVISTEPSDFCEQYHSFEEGFLCLGLTHNPRPDITSAETTNSLSVDRLVVDGDEVEESWGKRILRKDLATGPSGGTYDVIAELTVGEMSYALLVNVSAVPDGAVRFNDVRVTYRD